MNLLRKVFNRKYLFPLLFLLLFVIYFYLYQTRDQEEIFFALFYILIGLLIALFYLLKDWIYTPDKVHYTQMIMEDALFNHRGEILETFESYPLYDEFVTFHLTRKSEDPYNDTVYSLQAVRYVKNKMIDSLFIPIQPKDPHLKKYAMPLNNAIGRFLRYAGNTPIIIYNQPFTHTYLNIKLDKEVHISFVDAMKMSKDLYGITNKPIGHLQRYLRFYNLEGDQVRDAKVIGAIYLDYIYTVSKHRTMLAKKQKVTSSAAKATSPKKVLSTKTPVKAQAQKIAEKDKNTSNGSRPSS